MEQILNLQEYGWEGLSFRGGHQDTQDQFTVLRQQSTSNHVYKFALPDEGKSEIAFSRGASFGSIGKKVLLIDADIRKSVFIKRYEIKGEIPTGCPSISADRKPWRISVMPPIENFYMILAGPYSPKSGRTSGRSAV
ncbi:MAG: hypothetical protein ACLR0U_17180 [Enterocloster clostridioformis]